MTELFGRYVIIASAFTVLVVFDISPVYIFVIYSQTFHWPPYVGGPMRTILPVSFSFDMYFFIVVVDFERVFDIFLDEIFGFFFHARLLAAVRYPAKI